ncbi:sporulation domain-containing protein [Bacteroides sp. CAG:709]|nr:sporulation domain-containing protein [Bacteroides sp. CAG:709]
MDIDLLSKIVKELILDNDEVALPGIGSFIAEIVPSVFSDKGYTINPPYRRLSFRQKGSGDENMLIDFYARCNNIDTPTASRIIREFLEEMRRVLETKKSIVFPGLGKLRATKENYFFFVADEDLDIYPEGFGLEPISLKTHEETPAEVSATMAALRSILNPEEAETETEEATAAPAEDNAKEAVANQEENEGETTEGNASETETQTTDTEEAALAEANTEEVEVNANEPVTEEINAPAEPTGDNATPAGDNPVNVNDLAANAEIVENAGPAENTEPEPAEVPMTDNKSGATMPATTTTSTATTAHATSQKPAGSKIWQVIKWTVIILVILAVTALLTFIILAHIAPDFIDSILYTPEELEILNL